MDDYYTTLLTYAPIVDGERFRFAIITYEGHDYLQINGGDIYVQFKGNCTLSSDPFQTPQVEIMSRLFSKIRSQVQGLPKTDSFGDWLHLDHKWRKEMKPQDLRLRRIFKHDHSIHHSSSFFYY